MQFFCTRVEARGSEARCEAALAHLYTSRGAAAMPWAARVGSKGLFSAVPSVGPGSRGRGRSRY